MGSDRLVNEVAVVKQHQQRHSALVRVVDAQWLRACSASRSRVDDDAYVLGPAALMPSTHVPGRDVGLEQGNRASSRSAWDGEPCHAIPLHLSFWFLVGNASSSDYGVKHWSAFCHLTHATQVI